MNPELLAQMPERRAGPGRAIQSRLGGTHQDQRATRDRLRGHGPLAHRPAPGADLALAGFARPRVLGGVPDGRTHRARNVPDSDKAKAVATIGPADANALIELIAHEAQATA